MSRLVSYFARGCLAIVPLAATIYILYAVVTALDSVLGVDIPGLGVVLAVLLITGVGFLVSNVLGRQVFAATDALVAKVPLVKLLYTSLRDLVSAFVGEKKSFGRPVIVRLHEGSEIRLFGFLTRDSLQVAALPEHVAVYVPQAYNIGGQVLVVPRVQVEPLDTTSGELLSFMLSGGATGLGVAAADAQEPLEEA